MQFLAYVRANGGFSRNFPKIPLKRRKPSVCIKKSLFLLSFKGVAAGAANDGYLLIPGGPGATEIFRYIIFCLRLFHGTTICITFDS